RSPRRPGTAAGGVRADRAAAAAAGGQRGAVGQAVGLAHRVWVVADRAGSGTALEPAPASREEWGSGALPGYDLALGRTRDLLGCPGTAAALGSGDRLPAGGVSGGRREKSPRSLSAIGG